MFEEFNSKKKNKQCRQQQQMPEIISSNIKHKKNSENHLNIVTDECSP
jgi:delta-aminolevulinic acid dehydratase/porphobilinogen synthase